MLSAEYVNAQRNVRMKVEEDAHDNTAPSAFVGEDTRTPGPGPIFGLVPHEVCVFTFPTA